MKDRLVARLNTLTFRAIGVMLVGSMVSAQAANYSISYNTAHPNGGTITNPWGTLMTFWPRWPASEMTEYIYPFIDQVVVVSATGGRSDANNVGVDINSEMYFENTSGVPFYDFSPSKDLFKTLDLLVDRKIKPIICIGSTPNALSTKPNQWGLFHANIGEAKDPVRYENYIQAWTKALIDRYTLSVVNSWEFRLLWEQDNRDIWNPLSGDPFGEFKKCWNSTIRGMHAGGLARPTLNPGNLLVAAGTSSWLSNLAAYLQSQQSAANIKRFSFSIYSRIPSGGTDVDQVMGPDPRSFSAFATKIRNILAPYFPSAEISVDEGGTLVDENWRSLELVEGTELGAAWNAALFKHGLDDKWKYYANWYYSSAGGADGVKDYQGVKLPSFFVLSLFELLKNGTRLAVTTSGAAAAPAETQAIAVKHADGKLGILA